MPEGHTGIESALHAPNIATGDREARRLLEQPTRRRILGIIKDEPGIKISQLCRETEAGWGTVKYHLHLLKKAGLIVARPTGRDCLLFPSEFPPDELPVTEALRQGRAASLAQAIAKTPGASQKELCQRVHMTRKIIRRYVELLSSAGLVKEQREAQFQRYYPDERLLSRLDQVDELSEDRAPPVVPTRDAAPGRP